MLNLSRLNCQVVRFAIVGFTSNLVLYLLYLLFTGIGFNPKLVMTILYAIGVFQAFIFNKKWTFHHSGQLYKTFLYYIILYTVGYIINLGAFLLFIDHYGYSHQLIQGTMILLLAAFFFFVQKFFIFKSNNLSE